MIADNFFMILLFKSSIRFSIHSGSLASLLRKEVNFGAVLERAEAEGD